MARFNLREYVGRVRREYRDAKRERKAAKDATTVPAQPPTPPQTTESVPRMQSGQTNLVNFSPEELIQQVVASQSRIAFGATRSARFMDKYSDLWALVGPIILLIGTIGEVFLVLWLRQKEQNVFAGLSIVAVALVLEGTFLAVSYRSAMIRNRAGKRPEGQTPEEGRALRIHFYFWLALGLGVCVTQIIFIVAQTKDTDIGTIGVWSFAIARSVFTIVADAYTAFAHEEGPTTAALALQEQQARAKSAESFLLQKGREISILNDGILAIKAAAIDADIKESDQRTRLKIKQLENAAHIEMMETQNAQNALFTQLQNNVMRAFFDPTMPPDHRKTMLNVAGAMTEAAKLLEPPRTTVREEDM